MNCLFQNPVHSFSMLFPLFVHTFSSPFPFFVHSFSTLFPAGSKPLNFFCLLCHHMQIVLQNAGKRFNRDWIFRRLNYTFSAGQSYAVTGPNGSGKSTLLQAIGGAINIAEGSVQFMANGTAVAADEMYKHIGIAAPYLELVEEMTAKEFLVFHQTFKPFIKGITINHILQTVDLERAADKQIRYYSSGMKQRVKLAQAIFSDVPVILLDEPCTNLDAPGYQLYHSLINAYCGNKLVIVSSNDINEYSFCTSRINILDFKL